ncbi:MAG TPA: hypothetical protein VFG89_00840 [Coriobacteriia bacterium]|nr:hypothetical protein [Coriobacteriia bacterium]
MTALDDIRQRAWDFGLTVVTVALMATLGVQSFVGTIYVWWAERSIVGWEQTGYNSFVALMNAIAAPQLVALVVVMGLCVPKRLFSRTTLIAVSAAMVGAGVAAWAVTGRIATGVTVYLALASLIQVAVVVLTAAGVRGPSYLTQGRLTKLGSGLLHLGFLIFAICISALQGSASVLPVFGVAALLAVGGTLLAFYADRLAYHRYRVAEDPQEHDFGRAHEVAEPDAEHAEEDEPASED